MNQLTREFKYYLDHKDEIVKEHEGKYVVIKNKEIIGIYDDELDAINETRKMHELGTFLVHLAAAKEHTAIFHSRVGVDKRDAIT